MPKEIVIKDGTRWLLFSWLHRLILWIFDFDYAAHMSACADTYKKYYQEEKSADE